MNSVAVDIKKALCIQQMTDYLPVMRAMLGLSQESVASRIGMTRQSYNSIEAKRRPMSWSTCISLVTLYSRHEETRKLMQSCNYCCELLDEILCGR